VPGEPPHREISSRLVFLQNAKKLEVQIWGYIAVRPPVLIESKEVQATKGADIRLVLASVPIQATGWGPRFGRADSAQTIGETDPKLVVIKLRSGLKRQTLKVQFTIYAPNQQYGLRPIAEENSPFDWPERLAARLN
jgi:hypothetical protein